MSLARNALSNLLGAAIPAVVAVATVPYILLKLGVSDYGLLTLITSIVGYFAVLDINVSAGSTKYISQYHSSGRSKDVHGTLSFGLVIYIVIGVVGMVGLAASAGFLVDHVFKIDPQRRSMAFEAIQISSLAFLLGQIQAYLQSVPGALMRFVVSGRVEAIFGTMLPVLTVIGLWLGGGLIEIVWIRVGLCFIQILVLMKAIGHLLPDYRWEWPSKDLRGSLVGFSAYASLARLSALSYIHADKIIIGARAGIESLANFALPSTLASRVMSLVFRLSGVMFPHASALAAQGRDVELRRDYFTATTYLFYLNGAIAIILTIFSYHILSIWLNPELAEIGYLIMAIVAVTLWIDSLTNLPSLVNDGLGFPKVTGILSLLRAILGLISVFIGVYYWGIVGAALGNLSASIIMSTVALIYIHKHTIRIPITELVQRAYFRAGRVLLPLSLLGTSLILFADGTPMVLLAMVCAMVLALVIGGWYWVVFPEHRDSVRSRLIRFAK